MWGGVLMAAVVTWVGWDIPNALAWDPVSDTNVAGYKLYYGYARGSYEGDVDVGMETTYTRARVPQAGQTQCWDTVGNPINCDGTGQDGDYQAGVEWPSPRFTDRGNGTVRDNLTGLIWLKNADCFGPQLWANALQAANTLAHPSCGLSDGSVAGGWRLPNVKELQSLIHFEFHNPALSNAAGTGQWTEGDAFSGVQLSASYWSSTTAMYGVGNAWVVGLADGGTLGVVKGSPYYRVWPVRGGN
jgi:hypothetical protein